MREARLLGLIKAFFGEYGPYAHLPYTPWIGPVLIWEGTIPGGVLS